MGSPRFSSICRAIPNRWQKWVDAHEKCWRHILHVDKLLKDGALCSMGPRLRPFLFETKLFLRQHRQHGLRPLRMTARPSGGLLSRPRFFEVMHIVPAAADGADDIFQMRTHRAYSASGAAFAPTRDIDPQRR